MRMKTRLVCFLISFIIIFSLNGSQFVAYAKPEKMINEPSEQLEAHLNAPDCFAMDIIFIIDQSYSMSRDLNPNDPLGQRYNAPRYALDWLANNRLARLNVCPDMVHRVGVISFGTDTIVQMELTELSTQNADEWKDIQPGLERKIKGLDLGGTDPAKAFEAAKEMMEKSENIGGIPRKRAIIFLTDGQPCVPGMGCGDYGNTTSDDIPFQVEYMENLRTQLEKDFPFEESLRERDEATHYASEIYGGLDKIPEDERNQLLIDYPVSDEELFNSTYIWVVAMNDSIPYLDKIGNILGSIAEDHNGRKFDLTQNYSEIPKLFNEVMSDLAGVKPIIHGCGKLAVNPYLSGVSLDIYKAAVGLEVEIIHNGNHIKNGEGDSDYFGQTQYSTYGAIEHYYFDMPPAGLWEIVCSDPNGAEVSFLHFNAEVEMIQPNEILPVYDVPGQYYDSNHPNYFAYRIKDSSLGLPLKEDDNYPPYLEARVIDPNGDEYIIDQFKYVDDGIWESVQPVPVPLIGDYSVSLRGTADCVENPDKPGNCQEPRFEIVESSNDHYQVTNVDLFKLVIVNPEENICIPLHSPISLKGFDIEPVNIIVQLQDINGNPLTRDEVLNSALDQAIEATLSSEGDQKTLFLQAHPTDDSLFIAKFESPSALGEHNLVVEIGDVYDFENYRPAQNMVGISFCRKDPLLRNILFYKSLLAVVIFLLTMFFIYQIRLRTYSLKGMLKFSKDDEFVQVGLGRGRRWITLAGKKIPAKLKKDIKLIKASNLRAQGTKLKVVKKIKIKVNSKERNLADNQTFEEKGWDILYENPSQGDSKDRFLLFTVLALIVMVILILFIFLG